MPNIASVNFDLFTAVIIGVMVRMVACGSAGRCSNPGAADDALLPYLTCG